MNKRTLFYNLLLCHAFQAQATMTPYHSTTIRSIAFVPWPVLCLGAKAIAVGHGLARGHYRGCAKQLSKIFTMSLPSAHESNGAFAHPDPKWLEELREKVSMYLDQDFETHQEAVLYSEIYSHPLSIQILHEERSFRSFIRDNYKKQSAPPQLASSILQKIKNTSV